MLNIFRLAHCEIVEGFINLYILWSIYIYIEKDQLIYCVVTFLAVRHKGWMAWPQKIFWRPASSRFKKRAAQSQDRKNFFLFSVWLQARKKLKSLSNDGVNCEWRAVCDPANDAEKATNGHQRRAGARPMKQESMPANKIFAYYLAIKPNYKWKRSLPSHWNKPSPTDSTGDKKSRK